MKTPNTLTPGQHRRHRAEEAGFTLVELMVALVILAVGLLGVAKLSLGTVQANDSAYLRSQASELVQQIIDDMRANQPQAAAQGYDIAVGTMPGAPSNCENPGCSTAQLAGYDLFNWKSALATELPAGDGSIVTATAVNPTTGAPETTATITVQWDDSVAEQRFGAAAGAMQITVETLL